MEDYKKQYKAIWPVLVCLVVSIGLMISSYCYLNSKLAKYDAKIGINQTIIQETFVPPSEWTGSARSRTPSSMYRADYARERLALQQLAIFNEKKSVAENALDLDMANKARTILNFHEWMTRVCMALIGIQVVGTMAPITKTKEQAAALAAVSGVILTNLALSLPVYMDSQIRKIQSVLGD